LVTSAIPADRTENWLSESFAEYFAGLTIGALAGNDKTVFGFNKMFLDWQAEDRYCMDGPPIAVAPYLGGEKGEAGPAVPSLLSGTAGPPYAANLRR
jgi:hypothetical protein